MEQSLFEKYDVQVPRYTSYPALPNWKNDNTTENWVADLKASMAKESVSWSLYMHLPFCESLCTFCACNNVITKSHSRESRYINAIHAEWEKYKKAVPELGTKPIRQLHLGGGTPTFFSASNLKLLLEPFFNFLKIDKDTFEGAIEVDPRRCTFEQLQTLRDIGFNRISLGVQDFDPEVQKNVNRIQPYEMVQECINSARSLGYQSVNFDLIYGLPGQTEASIEDTARKTMQLRPDRIALYSLAIVPWLRPAQNLFQKKHMEVRTGFNKRKLFEIAKEIFLSEGYVQLGIDHFALPEDAITKAANNKSMHRNFMGYTEYATDVLLGLGMSSISETKNSFYQNQKTLDAYYLAVEEKNELPRLKGHILSDEDKETREYILNLMTNHKTNFKEGAVNKDDFKEMLDENLVEFYGNTLCVTEKGIPFTRHICQKIDKYNKATFSAQKFSSGI